MAESRQPWRGPVALLVALVNGIAGALLYLPVAFWGMEIHHASHFEGSSDFGGLYLDAVCCHHRFSSWIWDQFFYKAARISRLRLPAGNRVAYHRRSNRARRRHHLCNRRPSTCATIGGKQLALEIELRVPANGRTIEQLQTVGFAARMDAEHDYAPDASLLWSRAARADEFVTVPMWAALHSETSTREIAVWDAHESWHTFKVAVPASPQKLDEQWSDWIVSVSRDPDNKERQVLECHARYRVRFAADRPDEN